MTTTDDTPAPIYAYAGNRTVRLDDPEGAAMFLAGQLEDDDPGDDTYLAVAVRTLLAERETSREPVTFDAALSPCLGDLLRKSLTNDRVSPCRKAMITAVALLGAARVAAGHREPSKAWANDCYLAMDTLYTAMWAWADAEGDQR